MQARLARLRAHRQNIDRYEGLLKTRLSEVELIFVKKRLSEEQIAVATLVRELQGMQVHPHAR